MLHMHWILQNHAVLDLAAIGEISSLKVSKHGMQ